MEQGKIEGKIYALLCEGYKQSKIAEAVGKSSAAILKRARNYVRQGKLERVGKARYRKPINPADLPTLKPVGEFTTPPIMLPHKFGASYILAPPGRISGLKYDAWGKASEKTTLFHAQFGRYKVQIWLYGGFEGKTPDELIESGRTKLGAIAATLQAKYGRSITLYRFYSDIEWAETSKERSQTTAQAAGLKKFKREEVAGAIHLLDGSSHPDLFEIDAKPGGVPEMPTEHARIRHNLYSGKYEARLSTIEERLERLLGIDEKIADNLTAIRQRMEMKK